MADEVIAGIDEIRRDYESRTGKPLRIYKAYPEIGRGGVDHDLLSREEVAKAFDRALKKSPLGRFVGFLKGWRFAPYGV